MAALGMMRDLKPRPFAGLIVSNQNEIQLSTGGKL